MKMEGAPNNDDNEKLVSMVRDKLSDSHSRIRVVGVTKYHNECEIRQFLVKCN